VIVDPKGHVLILRRKTEGTWVLPKGRREEGESLQQTAVREVQEETGLSDLRVERRIGLVRYTFLWRPENVNYRKTVHYFLMALAKEDGRVELEEDFSEHSWVDHEAAMKLLTFENDRRIVRSVLHS
jgi:8-oxo-dGTP pyrophosphatase MutT (NUDIX family)